LPPYRSVRLTSAADDSIAVKRFVNRGSHHDERLWRRCDLRWHPCDGGLPGLRRPLHRSGAPNATANWLLVRLLKARFSGPAKFVRWVSARGYIPDLAMGHVYLLISMTAFLATVWSPCQAAGSFRRPEPHVIKAGMPSIPLPSVPNLTAGDLVGGCGRGRVRDPQTHGCRGPADIR
jgi:hypothetical protein